MADIGNKPFRVYRKPVSGKEDRKKSLDDIVSFALPPAGDMELRG